jgi:hypothetical protein
MLPPAASGVYASGTVVPSSFTGSGRVLPDETTVAVGPVISVTDWLVLLGWYSVTRPVTRTESPTATVGVVEPV